MEQQNKYYTPDISELHVGYELEVEDFNQGHENGVQWIKTVIKHGGNYERNTHEQIFDSTTIQGIEARNDVYIRNTYRTKYLDQSDIESCGWIHTGGQLVSHGRQDYEKAGMMLKYFPRHHSLFIAKAINPDAMDGFAEKLFDGECKSINELRKIIKWLNIK
jgi:hypothetical protein